MYTMMQHQLMDADNLDRKTFLEICDDWFYNKSVDINGVVERVKNTIALYDKAISKAEDDLAEALRMTEEQIDQEYNEVAQSIESGNHHRREKYEKEIERMETLKKYAEEFPYYKNEWLPELQEPTLRAYDVPSRDEWRQDILKMMRNDVEIHKEHKERELETLERMKKEQSEIEAYEKAKEEFLKGE
jgi:hypothetical protein